MFYFFFWFPTWSCPAWPLRVRRGEAPMRLTLLFSWYNNYYDAATRVWALVPRPWNLPILGPLTVAEISTAADYVPIP